MSVYEWERGERESMSVMNGRGEKEHVSCHEWKSKRRERACQLS